MREHDYSALPPQLLRTQPTRRMKANKPPAITVSVLPILQRTQHELPEFVSAGMKVAHRKNGEVIAGFTG
jgi:hypothetical protein